MGVLGFVLFCIAGAQSAIAGGRPSRLWYLPFGCLWLLVGVQTVYRHKQRLETQEPVPRYAVVFVAAFALLAISLGSLFLLMGVDTLASSR